MFEEDVTFGDNPADSQLGPVMAADEEALFAPLLKNTPAPLLKRGTNYSHEAMIDAIIANPGVSQGQLAAMFGYTAGWISQIIQSDAFQAKLAARSSEFRDPVLLASVDEQFRGILARGLELTRKKLEADTVSDNFLLRSLELSSRALGYGAKKDESKGPTQMEEGLMDLSKNLVGLLHKNKRDALTIEGELG